ncbi:MAG: hypothetical protein HUU50_06500 [Candidatus Brocadiae bacterium]|nr:hypothetical protein [Candidatus Brocadiia bacterium]
MSKELTGFQKSVPSRFPGTREQNPTSAWDVDTSPFHRMVEEQSKNNKEMLDAFLQKIEILMERLAPASSYKPEDSQEKVLDSQKKQTREYSELKKTLVHIHDQLIEFERLFQDCEDKNHALLESISKQTPPNRTSEIQTSLQLLAPIQKLVEIGQENFIYFENLKEIKENQVLLLEKVNTSQHFLLQLSSIFQNQIPEKVFWEEKWNLLTDKQNEHFSHVIHYLEQSVHALETFNQVAEKCEKIYMENRESSQNKQKKNEMQFFLENILFLLVVAVALFFLFFGFK